MAIPGDMPLIRYDLAHYGEITQVLTPTQFIIARLSGYGSDLIGYLAYVLRETSDTGIAPQTEIQPVIGYINNGTFTILAAYTNPLAVGDRMLIMHPNIGGSLRLNRSGQSGLKLMAGAYADIYTQASSMPWIFAGAKVDLTNMILGDTVSVLTQTQLDSGTGWVDDDEHTYIGVQPIGHKVIRIRAVPDQFGYRIQMNQTVGAFRTFRTEFFEAIL